MTTTLFSQTPAARDMGYCTVDALRKRITFAQNATTVVVGVIPARALVVGGGLFVTTVFNGTTPLVSVGHIEGTSTVAASLGTAIAPTALGYLALDELAAATNTRPNAERTITAAVTAAGGTTGELEVVVLFVNDHEGSR